MAEKESILSLYACTAINERSVAMEWVLENILLVTAVAALIFVLLIPREVWKFLFWAAAVLISGAVAFYGLIIWLSSV